MLIPCQEAKEEAAEIKTERKDTEDEDAEMTETGIYILLILSFSGFPRGGGGGKEKIWKDWRDGRAQNSILEFYCLMKKVTMFSSFLKKN